MLVNRLELETSPHLDMLSYRGVVKADPGGSALALATARIVTAWHEKAIREAVLLKVLF